MYLCFPQHYCKIFLSGSGKQNKKPQNEQSQLHPNMVYNVLNNCLKDFYREKPGAQYLAWSLITQSWSDNH